MPELKRIFSEGELVGGNYRVLGVAGAGGMGVVYRARDLRLDRTVALKFLPPELNASERDKERFLREARTASSLDHPNVGVIHGVEEADGHTFIVMAFYEGASLAQRIQSSPLSPHLAVTIASQMARGLAEAHARGIVHRDIKPSNVMLTATGLSKIVDFGLAFVSSSQTASQLGTAGTVSYMSPEQVMGRQVDQRSDIWSLGVVLAEMLTGANPFHRDTVPAIMFAILNEAPQKIDTVHPALQPVLYRALAKDADQRYLSCSELLAALELASRQASLAPRDATADGITPASLSRSGRTSAQTLRAATRRARQQASQSAWMPQTQRHPLRSVVLVALLALPAMALVVWFVPPLRQRIATIVGLAPAEKHVAVLPFDNIGSNPENAVLGDGLMDSLAGRLSNLDIGNRSLWVVPISEVRRRHVTDPAEAWKELGANLVVKGSVERNGNDIHLMVNLIDTKSLRQVGSADVEDSAGDLSTLENEAVARLAQLMNLAVTADMLRNTGGRVNPAAYEGYLTALGYMQRYDKAGNLDLALSALKSSVKTDPGFALGYAQLGEAYRLKYRLDPSPQWLAEAEANCQKAVELDNRIPSVYVTLGRIHDAAGKHDLALEEFRHALSLNARDATAIAGMGHAYENAGRVSDAEAAYRKAVDLQPDAWDPYNNLGEFFDRHAKYSEAIAQYQHALQITPDNATVWANMGSTYLDSGDPKFLDAAEKALNKSLSLNPTYAVYAGLGTVYMEQHRYAESAAATKKALQIDDQDYLVWDNLRAAEEWLHDQEQTETALKKELPLAEQWAKGHPTDATAQSILAELYGAQGQKDKALVRIRSALALSPNDASILEGVAVAYEDIGDRTKALEYIKEALGRGYSSEMLRNDPALQNAVAGLNANTH